MYYSIVNIISLYFKHILIRNANHEACCANFTTFVKRILFEREEISQHITLNINFFNYEFEKEICTTTKGSITIPVNLYEKAIQNGTSC